VPGRSKLPYIEVFSLFLKEETQREVETTTKKREVETTSPDLNRRVLES